MTALLRYDAACRAIAEAKTIDEVSSWIDKAAAVREYGRRIKNRQIEFDAIEIRVRAKQRRGQLLLELREQGRLREGRKPSSANDGSEPITLADLGITPNESSEEQDIARIEGNSFERLIARCRAYAEANDKHSFNVLKPPPEGAINGARSIMGSRQEPDDSLDYFPTPPWATRALVEHVIGNHWQNWTAWEPACGEGHIADVLKEYFGKVFATDIFDYGYGAGESDFLDEDTDIDADWIITNPPFGDKTEPFVLRALERARTGVAMFVRLQWLESVGRYENVFRDHPPTIIAFFAERVNLCKGRWEPDGTTATAYIWLVWHKSMPLQPPMWIPPKRREDLTHPDDAARFTAHPVIRKENFNPDTGEITGNEAVQPSEAAE